MGWYFAVRFLLAEFFRKGTKKERPKPLEEWVQGL